ncbi:PepSY-associated TM helix domain-containing protein [Sphingosinicella terrae]|uniref:PepSY-associated TM helix domain-containing protein n=1 Tax=Sphingosinicella terrae TaxID=2172047 RepID=UPI0013B3EAE1|nr:PepSY-associated TM helix domain-containing protein [Sphingosinicella terrae]
MTEIPRARRSAVLLAHRWISLAVAAIWLVQAATGILIVFHWEIDDAMVPGAHLPVDLEAVERSLETMVPPGSEGRVGSLWTTAGAPDRFDVFLEGAGLPEQVLIDGGGNVLRAHHAGDGLANGGLTETLVTIHHNLLAGDLGGWIIGLSGLLLLTNLALGLVRAWPRSGWRRILLPPRKGAVVARRYAWHRGIGLWAVFPAFFTISAGTMLTFEGGVSRLIGASPVAADETEASAVRAVGFAQAARIATGAFPGSKIAGVYFPSATDGSYRIRVLQPGEPRRVYGMTTVFISAADGRILGRYDALGAPPARRFMDILFPLHVGELGGLPGRLAVMAIGAWLVTMILLGLSLWWRRRRARAIRG